MKYSEFLKENYDMLLDIANCMRVGIWITDKDAKVALVNDKSLATGGLKREELIGRGMTELIESGYILYDSSVLKAMVSGHEESIIQELGEGGCLLAISVPLYYEGNLDLVVCIERNITEVAQLKGLLERQKGITEKYKNELMQFKGQDFIDNDEIVTYNVNMIRIKEAAVKIGDMDATVIITGESGTGKEAIANLIQKNSQRAEGAFIKVNCAAIPETLIESEFFGYEKGSFTGANANGKKGLFELADGGTLFLDEIGELPLQMQSKLLRVLQDMEIRRVGGSESIKVNVRLIVATNKNLKEEVNKGNFRGDLFYRLFVVPIYIPPLRQRKEDITPLVNYFLDTFNKQYELDKEIGDDAITEMEEYDWPGNVRELRNIVERLAVSGAGKKITGFQVKMCLNDSVPANEEIKVNKSDASLNSLMKGYEKQIIIQAVEECGTISAAARKLDVNKSTISRKLKEYGI